MTRDDMDTLRLARCLIRDMAFGWQVNELAELPDEVCKKLTAMIGDSYDFDLGEDKCGSHS